MTAEDREQYLRVFKNEIEWCEGRVEDARRRVSEASSNVDVWEDALNRSKERYEAALAEQREESK